MRPFEFTNAPIDPTTLRAALADPACGGHAGFEGWVRDHSDGQAVERLEYEAYAELAVKEGERIVEEAIRRFGVARAACVHRLGRLAVGELAVWVGVSAAHRDEAFRACRWIIDEVKHRVPIWKKEHYANGDSGWVNCERCATPPIDDAHEHSRIDGRTHAATHTHAAAPAPFAHDYSRQVALPEVGAAGQARLRAASVVVVGAGGLGVPVLQYLAAAGVGRITIVDGDRVEASNLHRQPLYGVVDVGRPKAEVAAERLSAINGDVRVEAVTRHAGPDDVDALVRNHDLVVECTDTLRAKFLVSDAAVRARRPAVFASVHQYEGQLQCWLPRPDWPCVRCLWPEPPRDGSTGTCAEAGVLGPVPATLGAMQAMLALRLLLGVGPDPVPGLVLVDLLSCTTRALRAARRADCDHESPGAATAATPGVDTDDAGLELEFDTLEAARAAGYVLVDVREAWEIALDPPGLDTGLHLPMSELVTGRRGFPSGGRRLVVCAHGVRSLSIAEHLRAQGDADVWSLRGGTAALGG
ncbi:MAG: ThiF family adenylyltransferase [Steroidobacteraceae bacterium]